MLLKNTRKKAGIALLTALACPQITVHAQTAYSVADCSDFEAIPSITADAVIDFTASPISCDSNTLTRITGDAMLELTSSLAELSLVNIRFSLVSSSSLVVSAPNLTWQSEETTEDRAGAALIVTKGCTASFKEDVTSTGCTVTQDAFGAFGGAVSNEGVLEFMSDAAFIGTIEGGALYNSGNVTFSVDATFEDNHNANNFNWGGGGLFTDDGFVTFRGAASFTGNEAEDNIDDGWEGIYYYGGEGGGLCVAGSDDGRVVFQGPVLFSGNTAKEGAGLYVTSGTVIFEDLVTFEDNVAKSVGDASGGGAVFVEGGLVEFRAGVVATGNVAKDGGAFNLGDDDAIVSIEGPVTMTGNEARYRGGAIFNEGSISIPDDAYISENTAVMCPGIKNVENWERSTPEFDRYYSSPDGYVEFSGGGSTYSGSSIELCYWGEDVGNGPDFTVTIDAEAADCDALFGEGATMDGSSILTWDTRVVSEINFAVGSGDGFEVSCVNQSIIFVTGGGEVTVTSTADSMAFTNIRFEIGGYSNLYFDVPELTMTGIKNSRIGGSTHVDKDSSLEFWGDVSFIGNSLAYKTDTAMNEYGGAAVFNAGLVMFRGTSYFRLNGQLVREGAYSDNSPGGAILNVGSMEFVGKAKFWYNFNVHGGSGGGLANSGQVWFNRRTVWRKNTADLRHAEEGSGIYGGHGAALYNFGPVATVEFLSKALFRDNVASYRGGAVGADGGGGDSSWDTTNDNKITFGHEARFKDNSFDVDRPDTGGAGLWVNDNATVEFQDKVVFRRNEALNGGAIMNGGGVIQFESADIINMIDNVGSESCPDIKNYDKSSYYNRDVFGDIDDPDSECGSSGASCIYYEGEIIIGSDDPIVGETSDICEF